MKTKQIAPLALIALLCACGGGATETNTAPEAAAAPAQAIGQSNVVDDESQRNVVQVAVASPDHSTLVAAVKAADLVNALSNAGPFTVYAPTNAAFAALPAGTVDGLLKPEKKDALTDILQYHVAVGVYKPTDMKDGQVLGMVNGGNATFHVKDGQVMINDAKIIGVVPAANGMVCVIDKVLLPGQ
ncbi:MAG: fasciclin domain-containing protein [Bacteroidetes bacterium]|nr:fasciclin domain-containing protein [Bacteroidota bacterium]MBS1945116.1 fasciclin domain-containing protein [Bacteroidota bacterium]